jgi:type II restriction/modification system DNA methylase subunit YeeA
MTRLEAAEEVRSRYLERLRKLRILDPACGSGNFLYLALQGVKDIENRANLECEMLGLAPRLPIVGPEILRGIEINPLAAELARTTIWIGDIQWRLRNGIHAKPRPILRKLDAIECRDALIATAPTLLGESDLAIEKPRSRRPLNAAGYAEAEWPAAEFIVGNPPFLGTKLMRKGLGNDVVDQLFKIYEGRVSREADFVIYWFEKTHAALRAGHAKRAGLVATNSIRGGANRRVLDQIVANTRIYEAWSDEAWVIDGAAVRVSLVCFGPGEDVVRLNGKVATKINADLTAGSLDLTLVKRLAENVETAYMGDTKGGAFDVPGVIARDWLRLPVNPNGKSNSEVLRPWRNGMDITRRSRDMWVVDFGWEMSEREASLFDDPFRHIKERVLPERAMNRRDAYRLRWWRHVEPRPAMWAALAKVKRYIATPTIAKHRLFVWLDRRICPDHQLICIARDDDLTFGILHSRFHESWSLRLGTSLEDRPRYTPTTTFETFPFPDGLTPNTPVARYAGDTRAISIITAAKRLDELRNSWLNPSDLVRIEPEITSSYPHRILPKDTVAAAILSSRTLTNLYNQYPQWLFDAHRELDTAVAAAYGWAADISEEAALAELLQLNLSRSAASVPTKMQERAKRKLQGLTPDEARRSPQFKLPIAGGKASKESALETPKLVEQVKKSKRGSPRKQKSA